MKNGVPFDVAYALSEYELLAYAVVFGQYENGDKEWDWDSLQFLDR